MDRPKFHPEQRDEGRQQPRLDLRRALENRGDAPMMSYPPDKNPTEPRIITVTGSEQPDKPEQTRRRDPEVTARLERERAEYAKGKPLKEIAAGVEKTEGAVHSDIYNKTDPQELEILKAQRRETLRKPYMEQAAYIINMMLDNPEMSHAEVASTLAVSKNQVDTAWYFEATQEQRDVAAHSRKLGKLADRLQTKLDSPFVREETLVEKKKKEAVERDAHILYATLSNPFKTYSKIAEDLDVTRSQVQQAWYNAPEELKDGKKVIMAAIESHEKSFETIGEDLTIPTEQVELLWETYATDRQKKPREIKQILTPEWPTHKSEEAVERRIKVYFLYDEKNEDGTPKYSLEEIGEQMGKPLGTIGEDLHLMRRRGIITEERKPYKKQTKGDESEKTVELQTPPQFKTFETLAERRAWVRNHGRRGVPFAEMDNTLGKKKLAYYDWYWNATDEDKAARKEALRRQREES